MGPLLQERHEHAKGLTGVDDVHERDGPRSPSERMRLQADLGEVGIDRPQLFLSRRPDVA